MSLILDALRKLERDKEPKDPNVVVVGGVPWGGRERGRRTLWLLLGGAIATAVAIVALWPRGPGMRPAPPASEEPASPGTATATPLPVLPESVGGAPVAEAPATAGQAAPPPPSEAAAAAETAPAPPPQRGLDLPAPRGATASAGPAAAVEHETAGSGAETAAGSGGAAAASPRSEASASEVGKPRLRLTAISERDGRPIALLNDHLVHEGDSFDGVRVLRIGPTEVEVEVDGKRQVISF